MAQNGAMESFDESFLAHQRRALTRELVAEERNLAAIRADIPRRADEASATILARDDNERARQLTERVDSDELEQRTRVRMEEIEAAIARLDSGDYGRCNGCGRPVGRERLEALPSVALCVTCKAGVTSPLRHRP